MTDPNMHDPQEQPEYGAYDRSHYDRNRDEAQTPRYFDNPYGNPYMIWPAAIRGRMAPGSR